MDNLSIFSYPGSELQKVDEVSLDDRVHSDNSQHLDHRNKQPSFYLAFSSICMAFKLLLKHFFLKVNEIMRSRRSNKIKYEGHHFFTKVAGNN